MGSFFSVADFKEPTTIEDCDSTWDTDSGGEEEQPEADHEEDEREKAEKREDDNEGEVIKQEETNEGCDEETTAESVIAEGKAAVPNSEQGDSSTAEQNIKPKRSFYAARDLFKYRHQYPNFKDLRSPNDLCNLRFYMNKIPFKPDGVNIEEILNKWKGDYEKLEHNHTYIQWLFPLREQGLNFYAKELTSYEIEEFKKTKEAIKRFLLAYKMMLDFFGIKLIDKNGNVLRAPNWQERFQHLNESQHNYLRITRILKSLGELGYENFKPPLIKLFLQESVVANTIPNMKQSALEYFVYTIKDRRQRRKLLRFACFHYKPPEHFIWGPPNKEKADENKAVKKTNMPSSQKKHLHVEKKLRHAKSIKAPESPAVQRAVENGTETMQTEEINRQATAEVISVNEIEVCDDGTVTTENNSCTTEETEACDDGTVTSGDNCTKSEETDSGNGETRSLHTEHDLKRPEAASETCCTNNIVIVESTEEESKDCLCSLSPVTSNSDVTELQVEGKGTLDLLPNDLAK
ncbi:opioid growth factor receptor-like protein 1 isoform X2 [Xenopus laevis]|uniref:Opioid growth factor receptor-like protein 1 isoform X2 n=1 Tax=Xenopus laevis TaxID=8355 RepID=A0A8J0VFQ8_XENLA|nr:opioid growth factor receptor-like protein 1 isoform X2 [Xenopus laevis]